MGSAVLDTLKLARALRDQAKFTTEQAEGAANAIAEAMNSDIATKRDLDVLEANIRQAIAQLELKTTGLIGETRIETAKLMGATNQAIAESKSDIQKWVVGSVGFQTLVIIGVIMSLLHMR